MSYENIEIDYPNFCLGSRAGTILTIDTDSTTSYMQACRLSDGLLLSSYELSPSLPQGTIVQSLEYSGPKDLSTYYNGLTFFTLIHDSDTQCTIGEWELDVDSGFLFNQRDIVFTSVYGGDQFNCYTMALENYSTTISMNTVTGTGYIEVDDVGKVEVGDRLFIGPSTATSPNNGQSESVTVTLVSGTSVFITASGVVPPTYVYLVGNQVTYYKNLYLFSDYGYGNDTSSGTLYKIDLVSEGVVDKRYNGIYSNVKAASWSSNFDMVGFIRGHNLIYVDIYDVNWYVKKSHIAQVVHSNKRDVLDVFDVVFNDNNIYRLQNAVTLRDNSGVLNTSSWGSYNYHQDTTDQYIYSIGLSALPLQKAHNQERITIRAVVRNQYGAGMLNKIVYFTRTGDPGGSFTPLNGQVTTDADGIADIIYDIGYHDPITSDYTCVDIEIKASTDGGSTYLGSDTYTGSIFDNISIYLFNKYETEVGKIYNMPSLAGEWPSEGSPLYQDVYAKQLEEVVSELQLPSKSKFRFPGGDWVGSQPPTIEVPFIEQRPDFTSQSNMKLLSEEFDVGLDIAQKAEKTDLVPLSQVYVSRHILTGNQDDVTIDQFTFVVDAVPAMWSYKNTIDTSVWLRLAPQAYSLNPSTLIFRVKEVSYAGDTGFVDVTSICNVTTYDAGGGAQGVDVLYNPTEHFHHNGMVYISLEIYDVATTPNIITVNYWFQVIPDYKSPYIINESPSRGDEEVPVDTDIKFDILDTGAGVDIDTLYVYINNRLVDFTYTEITGGYRVTIVISKNFVYGHMVEVYIQVNDASSNSNSLYDMWQFSCEGSIGPWFDYDSFYPVPCSEGIDRVHKGIYFNVYAVDGTGLDIDSLWVSIGGKNRDISVIPIIYRVK